jgi:hypothetical protein
MKDADFDAIGVSQSEDSSSVLCFLRRTVRSFRESKPRPFENHEGVGTHKIKGWRTGLPHYPPKAFM